MATPKAATGTAPAVDPAQSTAGAPTTEPANDTHLDDNVSEPSTVAAGDAPHDTTDPTELASTVTPTPSAEALQQGTVNGVLPIPKPAVAANKVKERVETYEARRPDGTVVKVKHNLETGATEIVE